MTCYRPLQGYRSKFVEPSGKRKIVFNTTDGYIDRPIQVPCGQCIGCRLSKSREWALRCVHEASTHDENCFLTLTYNDENTPQDQSLSKRDLQLFIKRLRKKIAPRAVRYFACGEYGETLDRPHYHLCLFGYAFPDKELWSVRDGIQLFRSRLLERLWSKGFSTIGDVSFQSAAYIARYCTKKITGQKAMEHYESMDTNTGEIKNLSPEFALMSRRPGIGYVWFEKFFGDCFPKDYITLDGIKHSIPRFYESKHKKLKEVQKAKNKRLRKQEIQKHDNTPTRLETKEKVKKAQSNMLKRGIET